MPSEPLGGRQSFNQSIEQEIVHDKHKTSLRPGSMCSVSATANHDHQTIAADVCLLDRLDSSVPRIQPAPNGARSEPSHQSLILLHAWGNPPLWNDNNLSTPLSSFNISRHYHDTWQNLSLVSPARSAATSRCTCHVTSQDMSWKAYNHLVEYVIA